MGLHKSWLQGHINEVAFINVVRSANVLGTLHCCTLALKVGLHCVSACRVTSCHGHTVVCGKRQDIEVSDMICSCTRLCKAVPTAEQGACRRTVRASTVLIAL